jgi:dihydrofolate reductase
MTARLIYGAIASIDGYVADERGNFDWAAPDDEVHAFINDLERPVGTYLYGRRMYETMAGWETADESTDKGSVTYDFAKIWQAAEKVVYSTTLAAVSTARTRLLREFERDAIVQLKSAATRDITIGGTQLAAAAWRAGLVDEFHWFIVPIVVGAGKSAFPAGLRVDLRLLEVRRFGNGFVYLRYAVTP